MNKAIFPLPEACDGRPWRIEEGRGSCNTVDRILYVPLTAAASDRHVRNHEVAHAKISPRHPAHMLACKYGISIDALQTCEDLRVHRFLKHCGIPRPGVLTQTEMHELITRFDGKAREIGLLLVAAFYTDDYDRAVESLRKCCSPEIVSEILAKVQLIDKRMDSARLLFRPVGFRNATAPAARLLDALFPESDGLDKAPISPDELSKYADRHPDAEKVVWGDLSLDTLPASLTHVVVPTSRITSFRSEGTNLAAPHRLPVDGRVFVRRRRIAGGTVLIDGSGSMNLTATDLRLIVQLAPAATVAMYSGRANTGKLYIIAGKGKAATAEGLARARFSLGNVVDGPALGWLGTQAEPRLWVSDGFATGCDDRFSIDLWAEAVALCGKHRITRVDKADAIAGFLATDTHRMK